MMFDKDILLAQHALKYLIHAESAQGPCTALCPNLLGDTRGTPAYAGFWPGLFYSGNIRQGGLRLIRKVSGRISRSFGTTTISSFPRRGRVEFHFLPICDPGSMDMSSTHFLADWWLPLICRNRAYVDVNRLS